MTGRGGCRVSTRARVALDSGDATKENRLASRREYHFFSDNFDFVRSSPVRSRPLQLAVQTERDKRVAKIALRHLHARPSPPLPSSRATDPSRPRSPRLREGHIAATPPTPPPATRRRRRAEVFVPKRLLRRRSHLRVERERAKQKIRRETRVDVLGNASVDDAVASARRRSFRNREVFERRATARRRACRGASACARADRYRCPRGGLDRSG